ncbi:MAG TPA: ABC transporter substrate-binding protein [Stellaceae bacterium]|jgi:NitT/TauT family transport system substrate-binding protein|nr:ABC transporter substrate-binding protein [Stellaceae bacterium]
MGVRRLLVAGLAAMLLLGIGGKAKADPVTIHAGWLVVPNMIFPLMPMKPEVLRHYGKSYVLDLIHFTGTPPQITALSAGQIDLSPISFSAFALAVTNAHLSDLRIIADGLQDGVAGWQTNQFLVLKDGPIRKVEDLKGQVVASNACGGAVDIGLRVMLRKHALEDKRDVTIIEVQVPNMKAALAEKKVALIAPLPPFTNDPELKSVSRALFDQRAALGVSQTIILTARTGSLEKNRTAWVDFLEDQLVFLRWLTDPSNHAAAVALAASFNKTSPEKLDWAFTHADSYRDPKGMPDVKALQSNLDMMTDLGFAKEHVPVDKYLDLSLVKEAASRIN